MAGITPDGSPSMGPPSEELIPKEAEVRFALARRIVAQRCLYGVDKNPLAVEMAKLSLWLLTLAKNKPFTFLDHAIRCGDSLVGLNDLEQLRHYSIMPDADDAVLFKGPLEGAVDEAIKLRLKLEDIPADTVEDVKRQEKLLKEANEKIARLRCAADLLVAAEFWGENAKDKLERLKYASNQSVICFEKGPTEAFEKVAAKKRRGQLMLHWPLEFPEVMVERGGFDAFVGNPPFIGNKYWKDRLPTGFQRWAEVLACGKVGKIDVVVLFFRRAFLMLASHGFVGLIATTTAREGASLAAGFEWISLNGEIFRALSQIAWPGQAGVHVCIVWYSRTSTGIRKHLDEVETESIAPSLAEQHRPLDPQPLHKSPWGFIGCDNGKGTSLILQKGDPWWVRLSHAHSPYLRPYISGEDITNGTFRDPPRFVVDCQDASLEEVKRTCEIAYAFMLDVVRSCSKIT